MSSAAGVPIRVCLLSPSATIRSRPSQLSFTTGLARVSSPVIFPRTTRFQNCSPAAPRPAGATLRDPAHMDDFSVGIRDSSGWYHSYSRDNVRVEVDDPLETHRALLRRITQKEF